MEAESIADVDQDALVAQSVEEAAEGMGLGPEETVESLDEKVELVQRSRRRFEELKAEAEG